MLPGDVFPGRAAQIKIASILCLLGLLLASAVRGRQYVVCLMSGAIHAVACCQRGVAEVGDPPSQGEIDDPSCCEARDYPALAGGHPGAQLDLPAQVALPVGWAFEPPRASFARSAPLAPPARDHIEARAGPGPPRRLQARLALLGTLLSLTPRFRGESSALRPCAVALTRRRNEAVQGCERHGGQRPSRGLCWQAAATEPRRSRGKRRSMSRP
jgi:hypothetical protein